MYGVYGGQQVGAARVNGVGGAALCTGTPESWVSLSPDGIESSEAFDTDGVQQVGCIYPGGGASWPQAGLWSGTADSWVNLNPAGSSQSQAWGVSNGQQAGWADVGNLTRASLWTGTAESWVDLDPAGMGSVCYDVYEGQQVGYAGWGNTVHACLWNGTAASWVNLDPGNVFSMALGVHNGQQVGFHGYRACRWAGTAASMVYLHPAGFFGSLAFDVHDGQQVGYVYEGVNEQGDRYGQRGGMWTGTPGSWVDLSDFPNQGGNSCSTAFGIWHDGDLTYVVGWGSGYYGGALLFTSRSVAATSYNMFRGSVTQGNLASLNVRDDSRLVMKPGTVFSNAEPPIQIILNGTLPTTSPASLGFALESNASIANAEQKIWLYNYAASSYELQGTRTVTTSDDTANISIRTNVSRFVEAGTGNVRAKVSYKALGPVFIYPWFARVDYAKWAIPG